MGIRFVLLVNKQGQTRLAQYYAEHLTLDERRALEGEIVRKCLARTDQQVNLPPFPLLLVLPLGCDHLGIESSWIWNELIRMMRGAFGFVDFSVIMGLRAWFL